MRSVHYFLHSLGSINDSSVRISMSEVCIDLRRSVYNGYLHFVCGECVISMGRVCMV